MKLEIKLKDPKYCDGCPCSVYFDDRLYRRCNLDYIIDGRYYRMKRPQKCIKENGK